MDQMETALLNYFGEQEYTSWPMVKEHFNAATDHELVVAIKSLIGQKYVQEVPLGLPIYFQRTVSGHIALTGVKPYTNDTDIPL